MSEKIACLDTHVTDLAPECPCGASANVFLQTHRVDACSATGVDPDGSTAQFYCGSCLRKRLSEIQEMLFDAFLGLRPSQCVVCSSPVVSLGDVVVRIQPLWVWGDDE